MAGVPFKVQTGPISTNATTKTLMQVVAAANHGVLVNEISISFDGITNNSTPIRVDIVRQSTAGTMTSLTPVKDPDDTDETLQTTAQKDCTGTEPTAGDILMSELVHPQTGFIWQAPFGRQIKIGGGDRLGVRTVAGATVNAVVRMNCEE